MKNIILTIVVLTAIVLSFYFLSQTFKENEVQEKELIEGQNQEEEKEQESKQNDIEEQGLKIEVLEEGIGQEVQNGDKITVHYTGRLEDGTKFDSSLDRGEPFSFTVGAGQVIKGWDMGFLNAKIGEKRKLTIPPELGYGKTGTPGGPIPPNATLIFEVEVLAINE